MEQKKVKIIGLKLNHQLGILQSCELKFDPNNTLIAVKGEVGSGKTTLQKSLQLGTQGSDTLKDDKQLYGEIDQEVQLLDGGENVFIGCKSDKSGALVYLVYQKDAEGKIIKDPIIDGVKATPAKYLKNMQTALTWRMDELASENPTVQRKLLLELYKSELGKVGVVFDKGAEGYKDTILGQIDMAENKRSEMEFKRKQVGGFKNQLEPLGIDVNEENTWPTHQSVQELEKEKAGLQYEIENVGKGKDQKLRELKNQADEVVLKLKQENEKVVKENEKEKEKWDQIEFHYQGLKKAFENYGLKFDVEMPINIGLFPTLIFDENGKITNSSKDWEGSDAISQLLKELEKIRGKYATEANKEQGDTTEQAEAITLIEINIKKRAENNKHVEMLNSYIDWDEANKKVFELREVYFNKLSSINTGVDGLNIAVEKEEGKQDIYLTYNGAYDAEYFGNTEKEPRKLSSYSGTQKPLICLLLQSYLLSKKPKAMRYLWIDNVPIDKKTKTLLDKMGKDLDLTIIVNITGDFTKNSLENGEILIEGGEVFFK